MAVFSRSSFGREGPGAAVCVCRRGIGVNSGSRRQSEEPLVKELEVRVKRGEDIVTYLNPAMD